MEIVNYPPLTHPKFLDIIASKKEFSELSLCPVETKDPGETFLRHQRLLARYISPHTPWRDLLVVHEMGTGKTATSIAIAQNFLTLPQSPFTKVVVLAPSTRILINYQNELRKLGLAGLGRHFSYFTFITFANTLGRLTPAKYREAYTNKVFVLDEVHHLVVVKEEARVYNAIHKFLLAARSLGNTRTILLTGTPVKDSVHEIAEILNLVLPEDGQLPVGVQFDRTFGRSLDRLAPYVAGRVSYLSSMEDEVEVEFAGETLGSLKFARVEVHEMSSVQSKAYYETLSRDSATAFYIASRQASQFAPGVEDRRRLTPDVVRERSAVFADVSESLYAAARRGEASFVYSTFVNKGGLTLLARVLDEAGWGRFVPSTRKVRTGRRVKTPEFNVPPGLRYILLTNETATPAEATRLLQLFNTSANARGEYVAVVLGSPILMEGVTIKHIRHVHVLTPEWNFYKTFQIIHRAVRFGAHSDLPDDSKSVHIHLHVSVPRPPTGITSPRLASHKDIGKNNLNSVDLFMYETAEAKDIDISKVMAVLRENSVDCPFTFRRNLRHPSWNNTKKCFYGPCVYSCRQVEDPVKDVSSWLALYADERVEEVARAVCGEFGKPGRQAVSLRDLKVLFAGETSPGVASSGVDRETREELLLMALAKLVDGNVPVRDSFGIAKFLRERDDVFYLTLDSASDHTDLLVYSENVGRLYPPGHTMQIDERANALLVRDLFYAEDDRTEAILETFDNAFRESILEACVNARRRDFAGVDRRVAKRARKILDLYDYFLVDLPDEGISVSLMLRGAADARCTVSAGDPPEGDMVYGVPGWKFCTPDLAEKALDLVDRPRKLAEVDNPYNSYGLWNPTTKQFCIRQFKGPGAGGAGGAGGDKRKIASGKRCLNWDATWLMTMVIRTMNVPAPDDYVPYATRETLLRRIERRNLRKYLHLLDHPDPPTDRLRQLLYWGTKNKSDFCSRLMEAYDARGLLFKDRYCGTQKKVKIN